VVAQALAGVIGTAGLKLTLASYIGRQCNLVAANTPNAIVEKINKALIASLQDPNVREQMISNDFTPMGSSPDQFGKFIQSETLKWAKVVKSSGARAD
jgi:tripartite-type tricarboxylate transporter receptor subunit TctC